MIKNLKKLRTDKGLTQKQLADILSVSQQSINKYENHNVEPDIDTLIKLADFFNTSVDFLIGHTDIMHKIEPIQPFELNNDEASLLKKYRLITSKKKKSIHTIIDNYLE